MDGSKFSGRYFSHISKLKKSKPLKNNRSTDIPCSNQKHIAIKRSADRLSSENLAKVSRTVDSDKTQRPVLNSSIGSKSELKDSCYKPSSLFAEDVNRNSAGHLKKQTVKRKFNSSFPGSHLFSEEKKPKLSSSFEEQRFTVSEVQNLFEQDKLSQQIRRYFIENMQQEWFLHKKWDLAKSLESILNEGSILRCEIIIVGSSVNGFGRFNSDCDMCIVVDKYTTTLNNTRVMKVLDQVRKLLRHASFVRNLKLIPAKVRILKFRDCKSNMECDLNVNNLTGLRNTQLMYAYAEQDPRVKPLVLCIKEWAHQNDINDASSGTLSSYALVLMLLHYLQFGVKPCIVPSLQECFPGLFSAFVPIDDIEERAKSVPFRRSRNFQSLSQLLIGFFRYYSTFDFKKVISVRQAKCFSVDDYISSGPWYRKPIRIEEPFDLSNVARAVREEYFPRILSCFRQASSRLKADGRLRDLMHVTRRSRQTVFDWKIPNYMSL